MRSLKIGESIKHRKEIIASLLACTFLATSLFSTTTTAYALTDGSTANASSTKSGSKSSNFDLSQAQQLQDLYMDKVQFDYKLLESSKDLDLIVQFNVDPAPIQMLSNQNDGSSTGISLFGFNLLSPSGVTLGSAENAVKKTHSDFKNFVKSESKALKDTGETAQIKIGKEYTQIFNGLAVKMPKSSLNDMLALPYVKSVYINNKYAPIPSTENIDAPASATGDGLLPKKKTDSSLLPSTPSNRNKEQVTSLNSNNTTNASNSGDSSGSPSAPVQNPGQEGSDSGERAVLDWLKIHDLQSEGITGKGVKVGVLDTGIDYNHPDLKGVYQGGYDFIDNDNDPMESTYDDWLKAKEANEALPPDQQDPNFPEDYHEYISSHGTHVSGTIAGNSNSGNAYALRGVAPEVQLYVYRVLGPYGGSDEGVISGIEQSYKDGCQIINLSLGSNYNDSLSPTSVAINNVTDLGVTPCIAAGNAGPGVGTVGNPGASAKAITVGANTYPIPVPTFNVSSYDKSGNAASFPIVNARLLEKNFSETTTKLSDGNRYEMVDAGYGTPAWYTDLENKGVSVKDKVVLVKRGAASGSQLIAWAAENQAKAMIMWNPTDNDSLVFDDYGFYPYYFGSGGTAVYTIQIGKNDGPKFYDAFKEGKIKTVSLSNAADYNMPGNVLASFSSTGPVTGSIAIKPDVTAPGVSVYSTAPYDIWKSDNKVNSNYSNCYQIMSGTSMATPHVCGMAALILQTHPNYKPADIKTALMGTADPIDTQKSVFQIGSGKADPYQAVHTDMLFKVKDYIKSRSSTDASSISNIINVPNTTGSFSFGYVPREVDGSVIKTGELFITNNGTTAKTFNSDSLFFKDTYVTGGQDGVSQGAKISMSDATAPGTELKAITVPAGSTAHVIVKFTAPATAESGYYEAYVNFVNSVDSKETYRIPLAINVQSRGFDFRVERKAFTLAGKTNFNPNTYGVTPQSWAEVTVKSPMDPAYGIRMYLMDITGSNYIGYISTINVAKLSLGNLYYMPFLLNGAYNPYSSPVSKDDPNLTMKLGQQLSTTKVTDEGGYVIQARALDASTAQLYSINSTVYVDNTAPTVKMEAGSEPGIYEIDSEGPMTNGALKWFSGKAYDSNIDYMKNVGHETSVPAPPNYDTDTNVSQSLGKIDGMLGDSNSAPYVNYFLNMNGDGTFKFGISKDDIVNTAADPYKEMWGTQFRIYPEDYSYSGNLETQGQFYYFVKKGNEYVVNRFARLDSPGSTTLNGIDPAFLVNKTLVSKGDNFKSTLSIKYPKNVVGAKFYIEDLYFADIKDIDFSSQYKAFLSSKGIATDKSWIKKDLDINGDFIYNFNLPTDVQAQGILNTEDTMSGGIAQEMPLLDITYKVTNDAGLDTLWLAESAALPEITTYSSGTIGKNNCPTFLDKVLYVKGGASITGDIRPEGFQSYPTSNVYGRSTPITADGSGVEIKFEDPNAGGISSVLPIAKDPTGSISSDNPGINHVGLFTTDLPVQAGTKPYNFTMKMPGHLTYYGTLSVNSAGQYGYAAGGNYKVPYGVMLAGDVNGDDVIDMKDMEAESAAYNAYVATSSTYTRAADLNFDGAIDYTDFEYIVKNFGKYNTTAPNSTALAGSIVTTTSVAITLTGFTTIPSGSDLAAFNSVVKPVPYIKTSDNSALVNYGKVNPFQMFSVVYKTPDPVTGASTVTQIEDAAWRAALDGTGGQILIDGVDRKAATNMYNGVTVNSIVEKVVNSKGQYEFDPSLFRAAGVHTIVFKAPGYMDRSLKFKMQDGIGNSFNLLAPNNVYTIGKALTYSRADGTGSTAAHYRDIWMPNITSIKVTDPNGNVVKTYTGSELAGLFNQITPANATTFNFTIPAGVFTTPSKLVNGQYYDWSIAIAADNYGTYSFTQRINAFVAPTLTAEANRYFNDINLNPISIAVSGANDTQAWRDAITSVQVGSTTISKTDFVAKGITIGAPGTPITIGKSLITAPGSINISISATNYQTATVAQTLFKQGVTLTAPTGTIYAGQDLVMTFTSSPQASDWVSAVKTSGDVKFGSTSSPSIKTKVIIDETTGKITIPSDLVRTDGGTSASSRSLIITAPGYADNIKNVSVTPQDAPVISPIMPSVQLGDTITFTLKDTNNKGIDNELWRSSILLAPTSDQTTDYGDIKIVGTSVKPYVTTKVENGVGSITIDSYATQSNGLAGNKSINFVSPYFKPISISQPFIQRTAPTATLRPSGVGKQVIITVPNNTENMRWANAIKLATGDIIVGGTSVKADTTISSDANNIIITLPGTPFTATGNVNITFKAYCYPDTTVTQVVKNNPPVLAAKIAYIQESTPITISFAADSAWLTAAPVVSMNGTVVDPSKYTLSATDLTFVDRSLFQTLGDYKFTISANGYIDSAFDVIVSDQLIHLITVTADSNGSINPKGSVPVLHGEKQKFEITPNTGYEIATLKVDGVDATVTDNTYTLANVTSDHAISVTFKPIVYTITFNSNGGSIVASKAADYNTTITAPTIPTREGFTFEGWYKEAECKTQWNFDTDTITADTTLYAKWTINSYTISFDSQGGSIVDLIKADYNTTITAPTAPTREGFTFEGWYKDAECITSFNFGTDKVTTDTTLYAKWTINSYTLSFDTQGGSSVDSIKIDYNNIANAPTPPTKDDYTFGGWYKEVVCENPWNFATDKVIANTTLYAKWVANTVVPPTDKGNTSDNNVGALPQAGALIGDSMYILIGGFMMLIGVVFIASRRLKKNNINK